MFYTSQLFSSEPSWTPKTQLLLFGWVFGVQLGLRQIQALIPTNRKTIIQQLDDGEVIGSTYWLVHVFAKGRIEHQKFNQTAALLSGWFFGVQLDSLEKSISANAEYRVEFLVFNLIH